MELVDARNTLREWFRQQKAGEVTLDQLPLTVPNEGRSFGVNDTWMRFSLQLGEARLIGVGTDQGRRRRLGRVFIEVFGQADVGDGAVSRIATAVEKIWRDAMVASAAPHQDVLVKEPYTFERPEDDRYCQVVSIPVEIDHIA
jgi:hypothetical protein